MEVLGVWKRRMRRDEAAQGGCCGASGTPRSSSSSGAWSLHLGGRLCRISQLTTLSSRPGVTSA